MRRVLIALVLCLLAPAGASAEVRHAAVDDPADAEPTVSGVPNNPDVSRVEVTYDSAGSIVLTVRFFNDITQLDMSQKYAHWAAFAVGTPERSGSGYRCSTGAQGTLYGQHHVRAAYLTFYDRATVTGYQGVLDFQRSMGADNRSITISASSPTLAGRDFRCLTYELNARWRSTPANLSSNYDEYCDCWYTSASEDRTGAGASAIANGIIYFDGYAPPPLPACSNGVDDDGDGAVDWPFDADCGGSDDGDETPHRCSDGRDNDYDGYVDAQDVDAKSHDCDTTDSRHRLPPTQCGDRRDNDRDTMKDLDDPDCANAEDPTEDRFQLPRLTEVDTKHFLRIALARRFKAAYRHGYSKQIADCRRASKVRVACRRVAWAIGDLTFSGRATIWYSHEPGLGGPSDVEWNYAWAIDRRDEYCIAVHSHGCVRRYRVR